MANKAEQFVKYATQLGMNTQMNDVVVVQLPNPSVPGEEIIVVWTVKGENLTFRNATVLRPDGATRKLRNASEATQWMEDWAKEARRMSRKSSKKAA